MAAISQRGLPPVHLWNPPFCGDIDMRIARDGSWHYNGTPIGRQTMVRLFSTVLRHDQDGKFYLVTPVEKLGIIVEDSPFVAVEMRVRGEGRAQVLEFRSNVDDWATAGPDNPIRAQPTGNPKAPVPYVLMRDRLEARINRAVFYDLIELGVEEPVDGAHLFGVWSGGEFFPLGSLTEDEPGDG